MAKKEIRHYFATNAKRYNERGKICGEINGRFFCGEIRDRKGHFYEVGTPATRLLSVYVEKDL